MYSSLLFDVFTRGVPGEKNVLVRWYKRPKVVTGLLEFLLLVTLHKITFSPDLILRSEPSANTHRFITEYHLACQPAILNA